MGLLVTLAWINRYEEIPKDTHKKLLELLSVKDYFVLTTNRMIPSSAMKAGILHMTAMKNTCHATKPAGLYTLSWALASIHRAS